MFKITEGKKQRVQDLSAQYWQLLNPLNTSGVPKKNTLKKKIRRAFQTEKDTKKARFYALLSANHFKLLKEIITGDPIRLKQISEQIDKMISIGLLPEFYKIIKGNAESTEFGNEILTLFNYKSLRKGNVFIWLSKELEITVCPYCNYEHTILIEREFQITLLHTIDHFMTKSMYPYFALSFYNMIPSCYSCNSTLKGTKTFNPDENVHPFWDDLNAFSKFRIEGIIKPTTTFFDLKFETTSVLPSETAKFDKHNVIFEISARYITFQDDIKWLNELKATYDDSYKEYLLKNGMNAIKFSNMDEVINTICKTTRIPTSNKQASRMPKGKFMIDLAKDFKITTYTPTK